MQQKILFSQEARDKLLAGINLAANVVKVTLGPRGRNVLSHQIFGGVRSTKDGVSALNEVVPDDPLINAGVKLIRHAAQKTADEAGDSTTTTTILAQGMINAVNPLLTASANTVVLRKEIEGISRRAAEWVKNNSKPVSGDPKIIKAIARVASNGNDIISDLIADAFTQIGETGVISLEDSPTENCSLDVMGGYHYGRGFVSPFFKTNEVKGNCELLDPYILLYDKKISKTQDILPVLEVVIKEQKPLLIIAAACESEALGTLIANKLKGALNICVVFAPEQGMKRAEVMEDIAIFTGGQVVSEDRGTSLDAANFKKEYLGTAQKAIVTHNSCTIVNGQGNPDEVETRQQQIKAMLADQPSDHEKEYLRRRIGSIGKGVAILKVGAPTEIERGDIRDLAEDAILATRAACEEGYLPGGGMGLVRCAEYLKPDNTTEGEKIFTDALYLPFQQLVKNVGEDPEILLPAILSNSFEYGYDGAEERACDLFEANVIDAAKVIRCAIENAASVTAMFLSTEVLISEIQSNGSARTESTG